MAGEMDIREALTKLYAVEQGLSISDPVGKTIQKVWPYRPTNLTTIVETPCFTNMWSAPSLEFKSALLTGEFTVNAHLLVYEAHPSDAADIASAFWVKCVEALAANVKLGLSGWTVRRLRGGNPTLRTFGGESDVEGGPPGKVFVGLDLFIDLFATKSANLAPGD